MTDRFGHGSILTQNMYMPRSRDTRLREGDVALVTRMGLIKDSYTGHEFCYVLRGYGSGTPRTMSCVTLPVETK